MKLLLKLIIRVGTVIGLAYLLPMLNVGITVNSVVDAIKIAIVLTLLNTFLKPILNFFSIPLRCLTFGLFSLVISAIIIKLADYFLVGFATAGWLPALIFGLAYSFISSLVENFIVEE